MKSWIRQGGAGVLAAAWLAGCALQPAQDERRHADAIAADGGLGKRLIAAPPFVLTAYARLAQPGAPLKVYIEGDGAAWLSRQRLSPDPTPAQPVALELAARDPAPNVLYLARPCQFTPPALNPACRPEYWSGKRYAEEVVGAAEQAIRSVQHEIRAPQLHLLGYSGGAALAVLLAARHRDVASLESVAGNLDPTLLNRLHQVSPLEGSLDPTVHAAALAGVPQRHWIGEADRVVSPAIVEAWLRHSGTPRCIEVRRLPGVDHWHGWSEGWAARAALPPGCR